MDFTHQAIALIMHQQSAFPCPASTYGWRHKSIDGSLKGGGGGGGVAR